jgi:hypothetical protein
VRRFPFVSAAKSMILRWFDTAPAGASRFDEKVIAKPARAA